MSLRQKPADTLGVVERELNNRLVTLHTLASHEDVWCKDDPLIASVEKEDDDNKTLESHMCQESVLVEVQRYIWAYKTLLVLQMGLVKLFKA